jgi:integrase
MAKAKKLPSGSWRVRVYDGKGADGKDRYKSFTAQTKKQAEYFAAEYLAGKRSPTSPDERTLAEAYARYIEIKRNTLSPSTVREYTRAAKHDFPELMPLRLSDLTQEAVQSSVNVMAATHSPKSVRNAHGLLSAVLRMFAPEIRLNTRLPQAKRPDIYVPTEAEIEMLIADIKNENLRKAVLLAAFGSLRRSECCALTIDDINGNIISVNKALVRDVHKQWVLKPPKSKAGYRDIKMPQFVIEMLTPAENGRIVNIAPVTLTDYFMALRNKHGLPNLRFHDLRHYQASILHAMGVPDKYIMERGGWSTDSTLKNIYQHTMSDKRKQVEDEIIKRFEEQHKRLAGDEYDTKHDTTT